MAKSTKSNNKPQFVVGDKAFLVHFYRMEDIQRVTVSKVTPAGFVSLVADDGTSSGIDDVTFTQNGWPRGKAKGRYQLLPNTPEARARYEDQTMRRRLVAKYSRLTDFYPHRFENALKQRIRTTKERGELETALDAFLGILFPEGQKDGAQKDGEE